jgi:hypothetical protein
VETGFNILLAIMQLDVLYMPIGDPFLILSVLVNEIQDESRWMCDNIKIRTTKLTSLRYLYIVLIIIWAILVTAISHPGEIMSYSSKRLNWAQGIDLASKWNLDDLYHLSAEKDQTALRTIVTSTRNLLGSQGNGLDPTIGDPGSEENNGQLRVSTQGDTACEFGVYRKPLTPRKIQLLGRIVGN